MSNFEKWNKLFKQQNLFEFNSNPNGLLWLKARAVFRKDILPKFLNEAGITLNNNIKQQKAKELFDTLETNEQHSLTLLDAFLQKTENEFYHLRNINETQLVSDLYKITSYEWGGDYNNSLDRYLVSHYVKVISSYDELQSKFAEIGENAQKYVKLSWYNNWTSYLIESIFKQHKNVVSAVGEIKSVDFFIGDMPFDLKVTFLPNEYQKKIRKELGYSTELAYLKGKAKILSVDFDKNATDSQIQYEIIEKLKQRNDADSRAILQEFQEQRSNVIKSTVQESGKLIKWLYESQGAMRFGAENRLFLILIDSDDLDSSWKLKRDIERLRPAINTYLDNFNNKRVQDMQLSFEYSGRTYQTYSDIIFVIK